MYTKKRPLPNQNRIFFFCTTIGLAFIVFFNLINLQIVKGGEYYFRSKNSYSALILERAQRGLIYDRNGIQLVENVPKFKIFVKRQDNPSEEMQKTLDNLSKLFSKNVNEIYSNEYERIKGYKNINEIRLFTSLDYNPYIFEIEANPSKYPLIDVEGYMQRKYLYPELTSHILGYTGEITAEDYQTGNYNFGDEIGKFGIEKGYDKVLRGQNGLKRIDRYQADNKKVESIARPTIKGQDLYLTIDIEYQKKLYELIEKARKNPNLKDVPSYGIVAQDVNNGQILAMASYPTFDSNLFVRGITNDEYQAYLNNPGKPLSNKATQYSQAPGSTFKILTNTVALGNNAINKNTIYSTGGTFLYGNVTFVDAGRKNFGDINMIQALCVSSNIYHMKAALALNDKTGGKASETIADAFNKIGLNQPSGINIGLESTGYFPTPQDKQSKGQPWFTGYLLNSSIGQGEVKLSPIGESKLAATIATKGEIVKQTIVLEQNQPQKDRLDYPKKVFDDVDEGMRCATKLNNTYLGVKTENYPEISIKTGSAETGQISNGEEVVHGWEVSYAPSSNPKVSMSIFMEGGAGGWKGGFISRDFYKFLQENGKL